MQAGCFDCFDLGLRNFWGLTRSGGDYIAEMHDGGRWFAMAGVGFALIRLMEIVACFDAEE